jgi:hypothetical protein
VSAFVHHLGLAVAVGALAAGGWRVAPGAGLERLVGAVVLAAAAAVGEALLLGLVGLGGSSVALVVAALATWGLARGAVRPARGLPAPAELLAWARGLDRLGAVALGAAGGLACAWSAWLFLHPALGHDMVLYHLPEAIQWVHGGQPGAIDRVISSVPVGSYPLTHEVLLEWGLAIGRSFVWAVLVTALAPVLIAAAGWLGLRALGVDRLVRVVCVAALVSPPAVLASQSGGASLDPAALAWLVCCAALCACAVARREAVLLAPAVVAAGLAIGTKTTAAPLSLTVLAVAAWLLRRRLSGAVRALGAAGGLALAVGGVWYLRNIVDHGWPLWPFSAAPWGDPRPAIIAHADVKFIDRPGETLSRLDSYYLHHFGGPLLIFCGALAAAVLARSRTVLFAAAATLVSVFIWMNAPFTGVFGATRIFDIGTGDATRYLLPGAAAAVLTVALASRRGGWLRIGCVVLLTVAAAIGLRQTFALGFPSAPAVGTPVAGMLMGGAAAAVLVWGAPRLRVRVWVGPLAGAVAVLAFAALGALAADGFVRRHGETGTRESPLAAWFAGQPSWRDGSAPVSSTWSLVGTLAGDRLQHPLVLVDALDACARRRAGGWLVVDRHEALVRHASGCGVAPGYSDANYQAYAP